MQLEVEPQTVPADAPGGCFEADFPPFEIRRPAHGRDIARLYALKPDGKEKWNFPTGGWVDSSPALANDGVICFGSWDKCFYAVGTDGIKRWQFLTAGPIDSSPAIGGNGTIYFGSHDNKCYALTGGGQKRWEYLSGGPIISSPALSRD